MSYAHNKHAINNLRRVGPLKPLGYLTLQAIDGMGIDLQEEIHAAQKHGLHTKITEMPKLGEVLTVWDPTALKELLDKNAPVVQAAGWPQEPEPFVERVLTETVPSKTPLYDVIADAFANPDQRLRHAPKPAAIQPFL